MKVGNAKIEVIMGKTGIGKTTYLALLSRKAIKKNIKVYSNVEIAGTHKIDAKLDIGMYEIKDAVVIIDEGAIEYNNRNWKNFNERLVKYFSYHRHYRTHIIVSIQHFDGLDVTIRRLAHSIYILQPTIIPYHVKIKKVGSSIDIDDEGSIVQKYYYIHWLLFGTRYYYKVPAWSMFDTHSREDLPYKDFPLWGEYNVKRWKDILIKRQKY